MPYILSVKMSEELTPMWGENKVFESNEIFSIKGGGPPVNYSEHILRSHSLTHIEAPLHTQERGKSIDNYFSGDYFFGKAEVVRLKGDKFKKISSEKGKFLWEVTKDELAEACNHKVPNKLILTIDNYIKNENGFHDPDYVLVLSKEASVWLTSNEKFNFFGTSWKSSDFQETGSDRPIHNNLFKQAVIAECLDLEKVPEGTYFLVAYPLFINGASESPVTPVLFSRNEISDIL